MQWYQVFSSFFFLTQGKNKKSRISPAALPRCQGNMPKVCFLFGEKKYYSSHMSFTYHISYEASVSVLFSAFCKRSVNTPAFGFFSFFSLRLFHFADWMIMSYPHEDHADADEENIDTDWADTMETRIIGQLVVQAVSFWKKNRKHLGKTLTADARRAAR